MEKYHLMDVIGSGTYGVVRAAFNIHTGEVVAIKKLKKKCNSAKKHTCQLREIKALSRMDHPNIVKLKEIIRKFDILYLVFEYMECNLYHRMRDKAFSEQEIRNSCFQIFRGLAYMHDNGYVHRDIKPENLLVSKNVIKIADFGLARETDGKVPYTVRVGTPGYCAPEVILHADVYDSSVDMWAMGVIMVELFTGRRLFPGKSTRDHIYKICSVIGSPKETWCQGHRLADDINYTFPELPGVQLSSLLPSASPEALNLIATLLSWRPCQRPTATEALDHPFFYSCYHVPPPLCGRPVPLVFELAQKREFKMKRKRDLLKQKISTKNLESAERIENLAEAFLNKWEKNKSGKNLKFKRIKGKMLNF